MATLPSHAFAKLHGIGWQEAEYQLKRACNPPFDLPNIRVWLSETQSARNFIRNKQASCPFDIPKRHVMGDVQLGGGRYNG